MFQFNSIWFLVSSVKSKAKFYWNIWAWSCCFPAYQIIKPVMNFNASRNGRCCLIGLCGTCVRNMAMIVLFRLQWAIQLVRGRRSAWVTWPQWGRRLHHPVSARPQRRPTRRALCLPLPARHPLTSKESNWKHKTLTRQRLLLVSNTLVNHLCISLSLNNQSYYR